MISTLHSRLPAGVIANFSAIGDGSKVHHLVIEKIQVDGVVIIFEAIHR